MHYRPELYGSQFAFRCDRFGWIAVAANRRGTAETIASRLHHRRVALVHPLIVSAPLSQLTYRIWQADHAQLDIRLLKEDGSTARPWLTIVIDDYSRAIAGFYLGFGAPSSSRTSLALR